MYRTLTRVAACVAITAGVGVALSGCNKDAVNRDAQTTFLNADDMQTMTNQMAESILQDRFIQAAMAKGPLRIVIKPVINETNEIIRDNRKELFVARLQGLLGRNPSLRDRFIWVVNREDFEKLRQEEIPNVGPSEDAIQPEYALYARFLVDTNVTTKTRSDTYLCQYHLTNLNTREELWTGQYETSKHIKKEFLD